MGLSHKNFQKIFENGCKPFVIEPTPVNRLVAQGWKVPLWLADK